MSWSQIQGITEPINRDEVLLQVIWFHHKILRRGTPWFSSQFFDAGIARIQDLYNDIANVFYTYQQLCIKYDHQFDVMEYNALIAGIPQEYKNLLRARSNLPTSDSFLYKILSKKKPSSYLSQLVRNQIVDADGCLLAWQNDLQIIIDENTWNSVIVDVYLLTNNATLRWFQYRLVHRLITTNLKRSKYENISNKCDFCKTEVETVQHLFVQCPVVMRFWNALTKWVEYMFKEKLEFNAFVILFDRYTGPLKLLINTIIRLSKQYIYASKCKGEKLRVNVLIQKLAQLHTVEKTIALRQGKYLKHERKWRAFINL